MAGAELALGEMQQRRESFAEKVFVPDLVGVEGYYDFVIQRAIAGEADSEVVDGAVDGVEHGVRSRRQERIDDGEVHRGMADMGVAPIEYSREPAVRIDQEVERVEIAVQEDAAIVGPQTAN